MMISEENIFLGENGVIKWIPSLLVATKDVKASHALKIEKISDDDLGIEYEEGLKKENVDYLYKKKLEPIPTGSCLILITPDSERTMCTYLGTAGKISENDVDENKIKNSDITFLEGYLWDEGEPKKAFEKAIQYSNKVAMSLSDLFCVERHKPHFLDLVKNKLDIIFANEQEMLSLTNSKSFVIFSYILAATATSSDSLSFLEASVTAIIFLFLAITELCRYDPEPKLSWSKLGVAKYIFPFS